MTLLLLQQQRSLENSKTHTIAHTNHRYSAAGRRLMAPLALGDTVSMLKCAPERTFVLMALCSRTGYCHVWNVSARKRLLRAETYELLQSRSSRLFDANVTSHGIPTVSVCVCVTQICDSNSNRHIISRRYMSKT